MEFNIGDRVRIKSYENLPEQIKSRSIAKLCHKDGEVIDKLWSGMRGCNVYAIQFDGSDRPSTIFFPAKAMDLIADITKVSFTYEFEYLDNVVVARFFEVEDDRKTEIARGHGHIIHEGAQGIAQAASYALKKIYRIIESQNT